MSFRVLVYVGLLSMAPLAVAEQRGQYLGDLAWPEAEQRLGEAPLVILPFAGGAKEHGPHLPLNADQVVMEYLVEQAVLSQDVIAVPPILHGWFPAFRDFPGTEISDPAVFQNYVFHVALSLVKQGANRIVFLNMGIANATGLPIAIAAREIRVRTGTPTLVVSWNDLETEEIAEFTEQQEGGHGDEIETSINLFLQPDKVDMTKAVTDYGDYPKRETSGYAPGLFSRDTADPGYSETGIFGDATLATAEKGRRAIAIMTREWLAILEEFAQMPGRTERE